MTAMEGTVPATAAKGLAAGTRSMLWLLLIVYVFNFMDRQIVNILAEPIRKELGLSDTQIGLMTGLAFALFYTFLGLPIARFADRPSTNRVSLIALALAVWSIMTALCGLAQNYLQLLLARIGVGVGEAGCTPAAHSLITDTVSRERRASALAFYSLGIPAGGLLGLVIGGQLADQFGWRNAFMVVGLPGAILAGIVVMVLRDPHRAVAITEVRLAAEAPRSLTNREALAALMGSRAYLLLLAAGSTAAFLSYGKVTWVTIFFQRTHGLTPGEVGFWLGMASGLAGCAGTWLGGWLADRFGVSNRRHVLTAPAVGMALAAPLGFLAYLAGNWQVALAALLVPYMLNHLYFGPTFASVQGLVPPEARAIASATLLFAMNLIGLGLGPLLFGVVSDLLRPDFGVESVRYVLYGAAWLGLVPAFFFWRASLRLDAELDRYG